MIERYIELLKTLSLTPRTLDLPQEKEVSLLQAGKLSPNDLRAALRRVDVLQYLHNPHHRKAPMIIQQQQQPHLNHPVNRYVRWRTQQILRTNNWRLKD